MRAIKEIRWVLPTAAIGLGALAAIAQAPKKVDNNALRRPSAEEWARMAMTTPRRTSAR